MKVDVILLTKNSLKPCLRECVTSIYNNVPVSRLIVVDGGSVDGTIDFLQKWPHVDVIDDRGGTRATARQKGIASVKTNWHVHVDSDVILCKDWFKKAWQLVDKNVGAVWGAAVPNEKHFFNISYAMSKLYRIGIKELLVKQIRSERAMMHDTLIRTAAVEDIKIPANLHILEDEYIGCYIVCKGYKFLKVIEPFCLHNLTPKDRYDGFIIMGYLLKEYRLGNLKHVLSRVLIALPKAVWIYAVTKDFEASKLHLLNNVLLLKGWLMH